MVTLANAITDAPGALYDADMTDDLTYNGSSVSGHIARDPAPKNAAGSAKVLSGRAMVKKSDVPAPAYKDTIVSAGRTWRVVPPVPADETPFDWTLKIEADARPIPDHR